MVSIVELIMLSWQQLLHNFQNTRVTWLVCCFFKLQVSHMLYMGYKISQFLIFRNCDLSYVASFSLNKPHTSEDIQKFLK